MTQPAPAFVVHAYWIQAVLAIGSVCVTACSTEVSRSSDIIASQSIVSGENSRIDKASQPAFRMIPGALEERNSAAQNHDAPLELLGRGTSARIIDREGNILKSATTDGSIYGLRMSPSTDLALIYYGDATYTVAPFDDLDATRALPVAPPDPNATGFGWLWLDDDHLLGSADLPSTDTEGKTAAEIEGTPPRATLLYVYRLADGALTPVQLDPALPRAFMVYETSGWNVTLLSHDDELVGAKIEEVPIP